ncbi:sporulation related protein [Aliiruegeria haliotis]|uniref:Sporulation related protein n=1 Tax=Aliiruegeria haliotis TaxID=1280846 RepID=A0A2T0RV51_9RHOB|nr:serine protease [Aliiruegeria haliotis]PRY25034.1 sporulation related protein [Aliiruegeria haliotis]
MYHFRLFLSLVLTLFLAAAPGAGRAQDSAWVQIEALRTLAEAEARARAYSSAFQNVNGFRMPGGWYGIVLGPYSRSGAQAELNALKTGRLIPADSYLTDGSQYRQQFWPVGADTLAAAPVDTQSRALTAARPGAPVPVAQPKQTDQPVVPPPPPYIPDETPQQARASERLLDAAQRRQLQEALKWEGFYASTIDGAFGNGTRRAMASWQEAKGYDATGVLTTAQRNELVADWRAPFDALGLAAITDDAAGIEIILPAAKVAYARTEAPFIHYDAADEDGMRVILISQSGDEATLFGLYDILQTLEIVPRDGARERKKTSFLLTGQSPDLHSHTYAVLSDGAVKGFTIAWKPGGDPRVMQPVVRTMQDSFRPLKGVVLPDTAATEAGTEQRIDLMAGLEIRRPERSRTGFFVDGTGAVLTTTDLLDQCRSVTIGEEIEAEIAARDDTLGLALLKPSQTLAPVGVARFTSNVPRINSEIALAGFSYEDVLDLPVVSYGTLADIRGLQGEASLDRLEITTLPGDAGGPVFDSTGAVLGMLQARETGSRQLPPDVGFTVDVPALAEFLSGAGLSPVASEDTASIAPEDLVALAGDITVRVSCWN